MEKTFKKDLQSVQLGNLDWTPEKRMESLKSVYQYVTDHAVSAMHWYLIKKNNKRFWARFLRVWAIILTALAGLIPVLSQLYTKGGKAIIHPAWATVFLLIAATFLALDRFFGFTNSWIRFISAELKIKTHYEDFQLSWQIKLVALEGKVPSIEQTIELLNFCREFLNKVNDILLEEMEEWKQNFKAALKKIDAETKNVSNL